MPIFPHRSKFALKKSSKAREGRLSGVSKYTANEEISDFKNIKLKLDSENELHFIDGNWINLNHKQSSNVDAIAKMVKENQKLEHDKRLLEMKMKIMLNLLTSERSEGEKDDEEENS
jgi:Chibby family